MVWSITNLLYSADYSYIETLGAENFEFNPFTGVLTINESSTSELKEILQVKQAQYSEKEMTLCFEVQVEKYRSIEDLRNLSKQEVDQIITMQNAHASVLEYYYQFNLASKQEEQLQELAYTAVVTAISTAISMGVSFGIGKVVGLANKYLGNLVNLPDLSGIIGIQSVSKVQQFLHGFSTYLMQASVSLSGFSIITACLKEISQEIIIDPLVETLVSNIVREMGFDASIQMIASTLAESLREEFSGQINNMFKGSQSDFTFQNYLDRRLTYDHQYPTGKELIYYFNEYRAELDASRDMKYDSNSKRYYHEFLGVLGTSLKLFATVMSAYSMFTLVSQMIIGGTTNVLFSYIPTPLIFLLKKEAMQGNNMELNAEVSEMLDIAEFSQGHMDDSFNPYEGLLPEWNEREELIQRPATVQERVQLNLNKYIFEQEEEIPSLENRLTQNDLDQEKMKSIWKLHKLGEKYVFGMIYKWINKQNGKVYIGRTEQRFGTNKYPPFSLISKRFEQEIDDALRKYNEELRDDDKNQLYHDIKMVHDRAGGGNNGKAAISATFSIEIETIIFISDSYTSDCEFIETVEDYYIREYIQILGRENVYNRKLGGGGGHVSYLRSGHNEARLHTILESMISDGFSLKKISEYLDIPYLDYGSPIHNLIKDNMGKSYTDARFELVGERMLQLIDNGYISFSQLASMFKGMDAVKVFQFFSNRKFKLGNEYLKGLISSAILKLQKDGRVIGDTSGGGIYYHIICGELGIEKFKANLIGSFMKREMKTILKITREGLINGLKYYASKLITKSENAYDLLKMLNYDEGIESHNHERIAQRIYELFKMSYDDAFNFYSSNILNM